MSLLRRSAGRIWARRLLRGPLVLFAMAAVVFSVLFVTVSPARSADNTVSTDQSDIAAGQVLYETHCQACHGYDGQGHVVTGAPALVSVGAAAADWYLTTGRMPLAAPNEEPLRHHSIFTPLQIHQLDSYIAALPQITGTGTTGPTIPIPLPLCSTESQKTPSTANLGTQTPECVTLSEGQQLYAINCAQCHQAAGSGAMLSKGNVVPSLRNANLVQAMEAPIIGPRPMPVFTQLTNAQLSAIAHYVQYLQHPSDPGGFGISHFGPVAEGFVAIFLGFVLLWFAARMIGNRG